MLTRNKKGAVAELINRHKSLEEPLRKVSHADRLNASATASRFPSNYFVIWDKHRHEPAGNPKPTVGPKIF